MDIGEEEISFGEIGFPDDYLTGAFLSLIQAIQAEQCPCQRIMASPAGRRSEHKAWEKCHQLENPWGVGRWAGSSSNRLPLGRCLSGRPVEVVKHPVHNVVLPANLDRQGLG